MDDSNLAPMPDSELDLSVDERLIADAARSEDPAQRLLVINLAASHSPIRLPSVPLPDSPPTYLYQIQRREDHRMRFRLRVGPISATEHPERLLAQLRTVYPAAFVTTAGADDFLEIARCHDRPSHGPMEEATALLEPVAHSKPSTAHEGSSDSPPPPLHRQFLPTLTEVVFQKKFP